jgi:hypothetical protein
MNLDEIEEEIAWKLGLWKILYYVMLAPTFIGTATHFLAHTRWEIPAMTGCLAAICSLKFSILLDKAVTRIRVQMDADKNLQEK